MEQTKTEKRLIEQFIYFGVFSAKEISFVFLIINFKFNVTLFVKTFFEFLF